MRLRTVIFSVYVGSSAVGFAVLMAIMLWEVRPRYVDSMRATMRETADLLATMLQSRLEADHAGAGAAAVAAAWNREFAGTGRTPGRMRVYVTNADGVVVADSAGGRDVGMNYSQRRELKGYFSSSLDTAAQADVVDGELRASAPVLVGGRLVAVVGVGRPLSTIRQLVLSARLRLVFEGLAVAAAMLVAGWWIASRVARAIERLTAYVREVRVHPQPGPPTSRAREIRELATAFEELRVELEGKAYVERYTQSLTHEIKAPIAAIRGAAELLTEDPPPEDRDRFVANLKAESARLQQIVERLLELASVEARTTRLETQPVGLLALLEEVVDGARSGGLVGGRMLVLDAGGECVVEGERFLLRQAVDNLIRNALEFTPENGRVTVTLGRRGALAVVRVDDDGPGVPEYALERVFERFFSLPRPGSGRKSTGLGLSFVREVALLHGGEVVLENRPEGGARAELRLPESAKPEERN